MHSAPGVRAGTRIESAPQAEFAAQLKSWQVHMERALAARLPAADVEPMRLHEAMRYSVLDGGKRVRPILLFCTARTLGLTEARVEGAACAIELVHAYSLVHDDLPAMDDDDLRRGRPSCHKAYDEATALLVGDALQSLAFQLLASDTTLPASPEIRLQLIQLLAEAIGTAGMAGGQAIDVAASGRQLSISEVEAMYSRKTGALIRASVLMAVACVPGIPQAQRAALAAFAAAIGLAFQIQDDLLDVLGDTATLGKTAGADRALGKPTYPAVIGVQASQERLRHLHATAIEALRPLGPDADPLRSLANWLLVRSY